MDRKEFIMRQIILNITFTAEGEPMIILNATFLDNKKLIKVVYPNELEDVDIDFVDKIKVAVENYKK